MSSTSQSPNWREILSARSTITGKQEYLSSTNHDLDVNATISGSLITEPFDYISAAYPNAVTEIYTYKIGGVGGITVATVTVVYVDSTKEELVSVTKV
jgi:hypothetical protein